MADYKHDHPGQKEPRAHGETHHENRIVDLNTAPEQELADLPMVGPKHARNLIQHRPFKSWDEVQNVPGFDEGMVDNLKRGDAQIMWTRLHVLQDIMLAHEDAGLRRMFSNVYRRTNFKNYWTAWVSGILFLFSVIPVDLLVPHDNKYYYFIAVAISFCFAILLFKTNLMAIRSEYKHLLSGYGKLERMYGKSYKFIRFRIFSNTLRNKGISVRQLQDVEDTLKLEDETYSSDFPDNFFTVLLVGLLLAIVAGAASIQPYWTNMVIPIILLLVVMALYFHAFVYNVWRSNRSRRNELRRFISWYRHVITDQSA